MKLKLAIPLNIYLHGPTEQSLEVTTSFEHRKLKVDLRLIGDNPLKLPDQSDNFKVFRHVSGAEFELKDSDPQQSKMAQIVTTEPDYVLILKFLMPIVNRVLRSIRNWGFVPFITELNPGDNEAKKYIERWRVQFSENGEKWQPLVKQESSLEGILSRAMLTHSEGAGTLHVAQWSTIEEAIQDNLKPPPEQEFFINSIEHLNQRNFRLALVEAVICLEIVLTQFLRVYLSINKKLSPNRIDDFLTPQFGITPRVSGLLNLVLDPDDLKEINIDSVRAAINWRNEVIHKTGHLPQGVSEEELRRKISSVLILANLLGGKRDQIESSPELQQIGNQLSQKLGLPNPTILRLGRHRILLDFDFLLSSEIPQDLEAVLKSIADEASSIFTTKDSRFNAAEHLHSRFLVLLPFPKKVKARWRNNRVEVVE
ncbi:MAG: hypothetical protein ACREOW_05190 [Thermodesulfobacteriota bacterium]